MKVRWIAVLLLLASFSATLEARVITDMVGRKVVVPAKIERLFAPSPFGTFMMYALAPDLLSGVITPPSPVDRRYLPHILSTLPVLGGGPLPQDPESIARSHPQLLIIWQDKYSRTDARTLARFAQLGIPMVYVVADGMTDYPRAIRFLGRLVGRERRAEELARQVDKIVYDVQAAASRVPPARRPKVYYAEGIDGLSTECYDTMHTEVLYLAGDVDLERCHPTNAAGFEHISLEQLMAQSPDVILVAEKMFYDKIYRDPAWRQLKAVRNHRVYYIPHIPFNWFDRPPSFMRFLGLQWVASLLYPDQYRIDIHRETKNFYRTFLGVNLTEQDLKLIMP